MLKLFLFIIFLSFQIFPQSFGFGCFGFVGGYAGYSYQKYEPGSLNEAVRNFNLNTSNGTAEIISDFGTAQGYRIGLNFFRAKFSDFFISVKGYYEVLTENQSYSFVSSNNSISGAIDFNLKSWNFGLDFGIPVTNLLSWKIIDGTIHFNNAQITHKQNLNDNISDIRYTNDNPDLGYSLSTGFIYSIVEDFVSLEGTAGYTFLKIKKMTADDGTEFSLGPNKNKLPETNFINNGGFNAVIQINVGFPL
jgi:hypothetical protein